LGPAALPAPGVLQYKRLLPRYKFLVLVGHSQVGKATYLRSIFPAAFFTVVQNAGEPNLRGFVRHTHDAIVLDQVHTAEFIIRNRGLLQANEFFHELAVSQTHMYAYKVLVHRVPIALTFDMDADLTVLGTSAWVQDNAVIVDVGHRKMYVEPDPTTLGA